MKIHELLNEAQEDLVKKFQILITYAKENRKEHLTTCLKTLEDSLASGVIYNVDFNEIKDTVSRACEAPLEKLYDVLLPYIRGERGHDKASFKDSVWELSYYVSLNSAAKQVRAIKDLLSSIKDFNSEEKKSLEEMLKINEAAVEIRALLNSLKSKIIKGRKPAPVDPNAFHSKLGSEEAQKIVKDAIQKTISNKLDEYEKSIKEYFQTSIDSIEKAGEYSYTYRIDDNNFKIMLIQRCFDYDHDHDRKTDKVSYKNLKITVDGKKFAAVEAKKERDDLEKRFMNKNLIKLSHLIELKGNLEEIKPMPSKPIQIRSGSGTLEAGFKFTFKDNSAFNVVNKIVFKRSWSKWHGSKDFAQFPTTFHDVIFPDGSKMKMPSEEKMIKEFGKYEVK